MDHPPFTGRTDAETRARWIGLIAALALLGTAAHAQFTITELNPDRSSLHPTNNNGASGGRVRG